MSKPVDDLSQDPFDPENMPEDTSMAADLHDIAIDKLKTAAGETIREAPKRMGRRLFWSIVLIPSLANDYEKDRMLDRLEEGHKVGCYEMLFGEKFSIFGVLRMILFFVILGVIIYFLWHEGIIQQMMAQQALIESLQGTGVP